jgi:23S rRNA (guanine2535-N1)-methyltransferase
VRLASEIFQRCLAIRHKQGLADPVVIYDPCCGSAYHLTALAHLHWHAIDADVLAVAARNLSLSTVAGLARRRDEIAEMAQRYGKASHAEALESAERFLARAAVWSESHQVATHTCLADATDGRVAAEILQGRPADLVISDVPYGLHSKWHSSGDQPPLWQMLEALHPRLNAASIVAIAADKGQRIAPEGYRRIERFQVGRRQIVLLAVIE